VVERDTQIYLWLLARTITMKFWDRIIAAIRNGARGSAYDINQIEIHYDDNERLPPHIIQGGDESHDFLAAYASFDEVQAALKLPGTINHISCVNSSTILISSITTLNTQRRLTIKAP
jgi:hypothetical protein